MNSKPIKVRGTVEVQILVDCPFCNETQDKADHLTDLMPGALIEPTPCEVQVDCIECGEQFVVKEII